MLFTERDHKHDAVRQILKTVGIIILKWW